MSENRRLAAILAADVVGFSRLAGADEDRTLARLRALRSDLIDPTISVHHGRVIKRTGDGALVEFRSVVDAVRCAIEIQNAMVERNAGVPEDRRIDFRIGVHLGDVVEESDGDLMGDGVNIAARLEGIAQPGAICLSEDAYRQVRARLDVAVSDRGATNLKNIAEPVRVYSLQVGLPVQAKPAPQSSTTQKSSPPRLSIVVLPFANFGGDAEQEYFVDGVTESLTTDFSRMSGMLVIGRNTAFTYKGKAVDLKQIGRELNVRYVLEGSVQRGGNRMRVNVQLIDSESGIHVWAERFDKPVADLFDMQDEIVARLANTLNTHLVAAEARRADRATDPDAMDLYFQGMACLNRDMAAVHLTEARGLFERALALDPGDIDALVGTAIADVYFASNFSMDDHGAHALAAEAALKRVLSAAPEHAAAHCWLGRLLIGTNRPSQGIAQCERALTLDRNLAGAHAFIGLGKSAVGRAEETEVHVQEALRLSPRDTLAYRWSLIAGLAKLSLGEDEGAIAWLNRSIENNRNFPVVHFSLAAALAHLDQADDARSAVNAGLALDPTFTIERFRAGTPSNNPVFLARRERIALGMRKAGVPEQ